MKTRSAQQLFHYWNSKRAESGLPRRTDIEPADILPVLPETMILQATRQEQDMTFRLAGTQISALFGRELRQQSLHDLLPKSNQALLRRLMRSCADEQAVVLVGIEARSRSGRIVDVEMLFLPLQREHDGARILGVVAPLAHPFWIGLEPIVSTSLQSVRVVDPDKEPLYLANRPEVPMPPALAPVEEALVGEAATRARGAHLTVIPGGRTLQD